MGTEGVAPIGEHERLLEEYKVLQANLKEALEMKQSNQTDEEVDALIEDIKEALCATAASLNAMEEIEPTPGLTKIFGPDEKPVILYNDTAPYEVHYDGMTWYSCVITGVVPPETPQDRICYKAWILGYNVEEVVHSEQLRVWKPHAAGEEGALRFGVACHAINPHSGRFAAARVERLTLNNTVIVAFGCGKDEDKPDAAAAVDEVPFSHVRVGRFYEQLRKRPVLTPEEKARRRVANMERKQMRLQEKRQLEADVAAQNANDWQRLVQDMGVDCGGGGGKRRRR